MDFEKLEITWSEVGGGTPDLPSDMLVLMGAVFRRNVKRAIDAAQECVEKYESICVPDAQGVFSRVRVHTRKDYWSYSIFVNVPTRQIDLMYIHLYRGDNIIIEAVARFEFAKRKSVIATIRLPMNDDNPFAEVI